MSQPLGLSANAWRNAKSWADTSFPVNVVTGDRIFRTDIGSSGGVWFTYSGTTWVPDVWAGAVTCGAGTASGSGAVVFGLPSGASFPTAPRVTLTHTFNGGTALGCRHLSLSVTGFTAWWVAAANIASTAITIHWIAVPA